MTDLIGPRFMLYDGRAKSGDTESAAVMDTADTEAQARKAGKSDWRGYDAIWFESRVVEQRADGSQVVEETPRWDLPPCKDQR